MSDLTRSLLRYAAAVVAALLLAVPGTAQVTTADITGRVLDQNGAAVANATVSARNVRTGQERSVQSDQHGNYTLGELLPGTYDITAEAPNFSKAVVKGREINVGTAATLNFDLTPGQITEIVNITSNNLQIETTRSDLGGVVTPVQVQNLPLLNRTFAALSVIMPEARPVGNFDPTKTRVGNVAFNGGDGRQVDVNVDGGDNKDNVVGSLLQNFSYESIQEFQVLQHRWTAEQGRAVGGVVNVITKSGSNEFHGSFFTNFRDEKLRALDFFEKQRKAANPAFEKSSFSRQEIGGSIGGPINKDDLFFFFALERFRERQNVPVSQAAAVQIPLIPGSNFVSEIPTPYNDTLLTARVDHNVTDRQSMFYRFAYQKNDSPNDQVANPATTDLTGGNTDDNKLYSLVANHSWTLSPTKLNQFSFHFQDFSNAILGVTTNPQLQFPGGITIGANTNVPQATTERKFQFRNDFSWQAVNHGLKFGANYIHTELGGFFFFGSKGYTISFFDSPSTIANNTNGKYPQGFATPGAVQNISFSDGEGTHDQTIHQLAFYVQDDYKVSRNLTLNLGLRWDANIGNLPDQTNNRTIQILQRLNHPLARAITGDPEKLSRTTPSWTEFQPRVGFAWDPNGAGQTVIRGGYGIFYDQLFQNLTLFSLTQTNPVLYQTILSLTNTDVGLGQLGTFRLGVDPLPTPPPGFSIADLAVGGFGRINDPDASEPYVQKFSIGVEHQLSDSMTLSSDFVHTLGVHEPRVQVINPRIEGICNPLFPNSNPASPLCVRGLNSRLFDRAFVDAGLPANRIEQINMIGTTNRSLFDSWTTTLKWRTRKHLFSGSYILASSRSWGGQPVASYSGNGIATTPENQFKPEEFGPTRLDERHRVVLSGVFDLPLGFQLAPIMQLASSRPYSPNTGLDIDGDGLATNDRLCAGVDPRAVFAVRGNSAAIRALNPRGCVQADVNSFRSGLVVDSAGNIEERSGRFFNLDLRATKTFRFGERFGLSAYIDLYNVFNVENLSYASRLALSPATAAGAFLQPVSLYGPGFGPPVGRPLTAQLGFRLTF
ncbi:MAG: TonB-dependent receptor [Acidobacteria bacterium]|nr:TonB-dependent receptor [Acidobacteriota bacterium]MCA1627098.1 TonB-dependent receptor [Acidobacteriota bacterium]